MLTMLFFVFKQKTAYEMRISDWSSDVCSSDRAAFTGIAAWLYGDPFLTSYFQYSDLPLVGKVPLSSAVIFDLGVFTLVVGATVLILIALAHQSAIGGASCRERVCQYV